MESEVLEFWFNELEPKQWFVKDLDLEAIAAGTGAIRSIWLGVQLGV